MQIHLIGKLDSRFWKFISYLFAWIPQQNYIDISNHSGYKLRNFFSLSRTCFNRNITNVSKETLVTPWWFPLKRNCNLPCIFRMNCHVFRVETSSILYYYIRGTVFANTSESYSSFKLSICPFTPYEKVINFRRQGKLFSSFYDKKEWLWTVHFTLINCFVNLFLYCFRKYRPLSQDMKEHEE